MSSSSRAARLFVLSIAVSAAVASPASAAASRTWVSGVGDDANPCSRTAPCKTIAGALINTTDGGEINALDAGGFGAVTITRAVTIDFHNVLGGVLNSGTTGITINAADDDVVLRGIEINGAQTAVAPGVCPYFGTRGIRVLAARSVVLEDSSITDQQAGVVVEPTAGNPQVTINRTTIANACTQGLDVSPGAGQTAKVLVRDSVITNAATAIRAASGGTVWLTASSIFGNATAFATTGTGAVNAYDNTRVVGNGAGETPTAVVPSLAAPAPAPTPASPTVVNTPVVCTVPRLIGKTRAAATKALTDAGCALGSVSTRAGSAARVGKVVAQKRSAGIQLAVGSNVGITVGVKR